MAEILAVYPGAPMALFQRYRVGSREKYGFGQDERLQDVLRRHLVFDCEGAVGYLLETLELERSLEVEPARVGAFLGEVGAMVDVRSAEEHAMVRIPGSRLLDGRLAGELRPDVPVLLYCHTGLMSGAAARYFAARGFDRLAILRGGIEAWSREIEPGVPRYGCTEDVPGTCRILAASEQTRFTLFAEIFLNRPATLSREAPLFPWAERLFRAVPDLLRLVLVRSYVTACRSESAGWGEVAPVIAAELRSLREPVQVAAAAARSEACLRSEVERLLAEEVNPALSGHRGSAELAGLRDLVAEIRMRGGCHGCGSVRITVGTEIARVLQRGVPELLGVRDVTRHETAADPYRGPEPPPEI